MGWSAVALARMASSRWLRERCEPGIEPGPLIDLSISMDAALVPADPQPGDGDD